MNRSLIEQALALTDEEPSELNQALIRNLLVLALSEPKHTEGPDVDLCHVKGCGGDVDRETDLCERCWVDNSPSSLERCSGCGHWRKCHCDFGDRSMPDFCEVEGCECDSFTAPAAAEPAAKPGVNTRHDDGSMLGAYHLRRRT